MRVKRLRASLVVALACGVVVAGCGGDDEEPVAADPTTSTPTEIPRLDSTGTAPTTTTEKPKAPNKEQAAPQTSTREAPKPAPAKRKPSRAERKRVENACTQYVEASNLSASVKRDLRKVCVDAGEGDDEAVARATAEVCVRVVEQSFPEGELRDQAVQSCDAMRNAPQAGSR